MTTSTKTRRSAFDRTYNSSFSWKRRRRLNGDIHHHSSGDSPRVERYYGTQVTVSESHDWPPKGGLSDVGGPFSTQKTICLVPSQMVNHDFQVPLASGYYDLEMYKTRTSYTTPVLLTGPVSTATAAMPTPQKSSEDELNAAGATAIARCKPTNSTAELSVGLGEIVKEGLPHLIGHRTWRERTLTAKNAGSEYLNVQFGWAPLVSEVSDFGAAVINSDSILEQYEHDKGKTIRRRFNFPTVEQHTTTTLGRKNPNGIPFAASGVVHREGTWVKTTIVSKKRWFSGAFVYGVPGSLAASSGIGDMAAKADKLFGISLTPDVLWNLTPWSWAIDWFTNTGDVLSTLGDMVSQGLVMRYGYIMEEISVKDIYSLTGAIVNGRPIEPPPAVLETITKTRVPANPYGFGLTWDGLSSFQVSILAALGISRR